MKSHLKVKVFSLAAEMTYIRKQEEKWKERARAARAKGRDSAYHEANFWSQRYHRQNLKSEARATHLAYGFLRGNPYSAMEPICYGGLKGYGSSEPAWSTIEGMVERFTKDEPNPQGTMQKFAEWLSDAKLWFEGNPERIEKLNQERPARVAALKAQKKPYKAA